MQIYNFFFNCTLIHKIHLGHLAGFDAIHDVDVRFHGFIVTVSRPFHDDVRRDSPGQGINDESTPSRMGAHQFVFFLYLINTFVSSVSGDALLLVNTGNTAQNLDIPIHGLIGVIRKDQTVLGRDILVLLQDRTHHIIDLN